MDFYSLLGVTRTASLADVERAYRRLARRYHPGLNPGDRVAEQTYERIQEAYRTLGDADRRRAYDRGAFASGEDAAPVSVSFEGFDFSTPAEGPLAATFSELFSEVFQQAAREATTPSRGADLALTLHAPFADAMRGCDVPVSVTRHERCVGCGGRGHVRRATGQCPACEGHGSRRWARGHMVFTKPCELCHGEGQAASETCRLCRGVGVMPRTEVVTIHIPPGIESGARLVVPGHGHAGSLGGPSGDLYVTVEVGEHPIFRRVGPDVHLSLPVAVHEAALGAVIMVPTLDGAVRVRVPVGAASGQQIILRGHGGLRGPDERGDLVATLQIVLPSSLDERSRELLLEFGRLNGDDVRRHYFDHVPPVENRDKRA